MNGLAEGTVIQTVDTGRVYKIVGGAPVWLSSCAGGICPNPLLAKQEVINAGPAWPRDGATAVDEAGNVFKFVGGAPIHLSSCHVGCGSPVAITGWSVATLEHMRPYPVDGATARDEANIWKFVGGAPIHLSSCSVGCGAPVFITTWSVATLEHMRPHPVDGATARDEANNVFKFVGGAPIHLSACNVGCGNPVPINAWSIDTLEHMRATPADNATAIDELGKIFKFAGGAPLHLSACNVGCGNPVPINAWSIDTREHMLPAPADGTGLLAGENGTLYMMSGGEATLVGPCPQQWSCGASVTVNQFTIDPLAQSAANRGPTYAQLSRFNQPGSNDHFTTGGGVPGGYRFEGPLGTLELDAKPGTRPLLSCQIDGDTFTSPDANCEGQRKLGVLGWIYLEPPAGQATHPLYRCRIAGSGEHFDSVDVNCEGHNREMLLGYPLALATVTRYYNGTARDHWTTIRNPALGYQPEGSLGRVFTVQAPGTHLVMSCMLANDEFSSLDPNCEGQRKLGPLGFLYDTPPAGVPVLGLYRCRFDTGQHFDSTDRNCEGQTFETLLGYTLAKVALVRGTRGADNMGVAGASPPGYQASHTFGYLSMINEPGTQILMSCTAGENDTFESLDPNCEGAHIRGGLGYIWSQSHPTVHSVPIYRCVVVVNGNHFLSFDANCETQRSEGRLGYVARA